MRKTKSAYWQTCAFFLMTIITSSLSATTIVMPSDDQLVAKSQVIVIGTVLSTEVVVRHGGIWTDTTISVEEILRGSSIAQKIVVTEVGGVLGDQVSVVYGNPEYQAGERVLVFLSRTAEGRFRTRDLFVGKFTERRDADGQRLWHRNDAIARTNLLDNRFQPLATTGLQRNADRFETFIEEEVAGGDSNVSYLVDAARSNISENFALISEPNLYRWFAFDNGGSAPWQSFGTQSGYSDGGISELRSGMAAWTGYSDARINFTYSGAGSGTPGGLSTPNGVNEVIFGDLMNEVEGTWDGRSGVVGRGGFNNVRSGGSWTSPFAADASHPQQTYSSSGNIVEGNLVIQDGVSPSRGISSVTLAEILAHEFGHTLGFGHSTDGTALMYSSVTGLGASLRTDDRTAARWLYPNGSGTTTPPPPPPPDGPPVAPSNLAASLVSPDIRLTWTDNSTTETQQHIYMSTGGAFTREGTVAANVNAVRVSNLRSGVTYSFRITAANAAGESAFSNTAMIAAPSAPLQASFVVSATSGTAGVTSFAFQDQSTGSIARRSWSFGDGTSSTEVNPSHVYTMSGSFVATLVVYGSDNSQSSFSRSILVASNSSSLAASFAFSPNEPTTADSVRFTDRSAGATSWYWTFGDGTTSNAQNPTKRFETPGSRTVTLTVSDGSRSTSTSASLYVAAASPATPQVNAEFEFSAVTPRTGEAIAFSDRSSGSPTNWNWNFGDGTSSTQQNPLKAYSSAGDYTVTLVVSNAAGSSSRSRSVSVARAISEVRSLVPVSAQTAGVAGTEWRTELTVFNAATTAVNIDITYVPSPGGASQVRSTVLSAGTSQTFPNALRDLFGISSGAGALEIVGTSLISTPDLRVSSRTFTGGTETGTYGQFVPDTATIGREVYLAALESNPEYRTNIGFVNRSSAYSAATLTLHDSSGTLLGSTTAGFGGGTFQQMAITSLFPQITSRSLRGMSMRIVVDRADTLAVYASTIDNRTQDPVYQPAVAASSGGDLVIPAVGRTAGAGNTFWRSDVTIFNPGVTTLNLAISYLPQGSDNRNATARGAVIYAGTSATISDVLTWLGAGNGTGALRIQWTGSSIGPVVTSRTYTPRASDGGTFGQSIDPIEPRHFSSGQIVTGLRSDSQFRSNAGFVNGSSETLTARVALVSESGQELGSSFVTLAPRSQIQASLSNLFPSISVATLGHVTLRAEASGNALFAYGSVVDNFSGDPVFISGR